MDGTAIATAALATFIPRPQMYVDNRGNVVYHHNHAPMVWHTWGLGSIPERIIMAQAFIAAAGRAPVIQVPATRRGTSYRCRPASCSRLPA